MNKNTRRQKVMVSVNMALDNKFIKMTIALDILKTFDKVWHWGGG